MKSFNTKRLKTLQERRSLLYEIIELSISNEVMTQLIKSRSVILEDLNRECEEKSKQVRLIKQQKEEKEKHLADIKAELKAMKVERRRNIYLQEFIYNESGLFRCGNNPDPTALRCVCPGGRCVKSVNERKDFEKQEKTSLLQAVFDKAFTTDLDECKAMLRVNNDKIREIRVNTKSIEEYENREQKIELMKKEMEQLN